MSEGPKGGNLKTKRPEHEELISEYEYPSDRIDPWKGKKMRKKIV